MNVNFVSYTNLELLEDAFENSLENGDNGMTKDFGMNISILLSHIKITYIVSEISILDSVMLKRFCNGELIDLETSFDDNVINMTEFPITYRAMQSMFILTDQIDHDSDVTVKPGPLYFPAKCVEKKVMVTFTGHSILSLLGTINRGTQCIFIRCKMEQKKNPDRPKDEIMKDLLIQIFYEEFYKFMSYKNQYIDVLTDSTLHYTYLEPIENDANLVHISHINSPFGVIKILNSTVEKYNEYISNIKMNKSNITGIDILKTTDIYLSCNSSFYTYLELFLYLPSGTILEHVDIKVLYSSSNLIIPSEMGKYTVRLTSIFKKMLSERENEGKKEKQKISLDKYNLILLNTKIQYTLKFNLDSISSIILTLKKEVENGKYGDTNNYISKEILKMISDIIHFAKVAYQTLNK